MPSEGGRGVDRGSREFPREEGQSRERSGPRGEGRQPAHTGLWEQRTKQGPPPLATRWVTETIGNMAVAWGLWQQVKNADGIPGCFIRKLS